MGLLQTNEKYKVLTEDDAKRLLESLKENAKKEGYFLNKCGYTYRKKTKSGEIIDECYIVDCVKVYHSLWEE